MITVTSLLESCEDEIKEAKFLYGAWDSLDARYVLTSSIFTGARLPWCLLADDMNPWSKYMEAKDIKLLVLHLNIQIYAHVLPSQRGLSCLPI